MTDRTITLQDVFNYLQPNVHIANPNVEDCDCHWCNTWMWLSNIEYKILENIND